MLVRPDDGISRQLYTDYCHHASLVDRASGWRAVGATELKSPSWGPGSPGTRTRTRTQGRLFRLWRLGRGGGGGSGQSSRSATMVRSRRWSLERRAMCVPGHHKVNMPRNGELSPQSPAVFFNFPRPICLWNSAVFVVRGTCRRCRPGHRYLNPAPLLRWRSEILASGQLTVLATKSEKSLVHTNKRACVTWASRGTFLHARGKIYKISISWTSSLVTIKARVINVTFNLRLWRSKWPEAASFIALSIQICDTDTMSSFPRLKYSVMTSFLLRFEAAAYLIEFF